LVGVGPIVPVGVADQDAVAAVGIIGGRTAIIKLVPAAVFVGEVILKENIGIPVVIAVAVTIAITEGQFRQIAGQRGQAEQKYNQ